MIHQSIRPGVLIFVKVMIHQPIRPGVLIFAKVIHRPGRVIVSQYGRIHRRGYDSSNTPGRIDSCENDYHPIRSGVLISRPGVLIFATTIEKRSARAY